LKVVFQKARFFSAGGRHGTEGNSARQIEFSYHIEVRTLNARRMFREKCLGVYGAGGNKITLSSYGRRVVTNACVLCIQPASANKVCPPAE
jgi:hypothetical protein